MVILLLEGREEGDSRFLSIVSGGGGDTVDVVSERIVSASDSIDGIELLYQ